MSRKYTKESVDMIYENAKRIGYNAGFSDGYDKGIQDAKKMLDRLGGKERVAQLFGDEE